MARRIKLTPLAVRAIFAECNQPYPGIIRCERIANEAFAAKITDHAEACAFVRALFTRELELTAQTERMVAEAEARHRADLADLAESYRQSAEIATVAPIRHTWEEAGRPAEALYYERGLTPGRPIRATFSHDGSRVYDARTGKRLAHYASPVPMWLAPIVVEAEPVEQVVIIPCGGKKLDTAAAAGELYIGSYHRAMRRAADAIAARTGARVLILSALHGLLELDQLVEPYNLRMGQPGSVTADQLVEQAAALGVRAAHVTVLAGKDYANAVTAVWPDAVRPMDGTGGMGPQLAVAKRIAEGELADQQAPAERPGDTRPTLRTPLVGEQLAVIPAPPLDLLAVGFPRRRLRSGRLVHLGRADRAARLLAGVGL